MSYWPLRVGRLSEDCGTVVRWAQISICIGLLGLAGVATAQLQVGDNTKMSAGGLFTVGYAGDSGDNIQSSHGLQFGASGTLDGYYYNPNFLNFSATPYYNQSKADSNYQSLTNASGIAASANFFTGSKFPGSVSYRYDYNSTGTLGLEGVPNFTTQGNGQGFGINWSALLPDLPTLSVGYQHGSGSGTLYGTDEKTSARQNLFNVHSSYLLAGFNLNGYYDHTTLNSDIPFFLSGTGSNILDSSGWDWGVGASRSIPFWNGSMYASYNHSTYNSNYLTTSTQVAADSGYNADIETAGANFHPSRKLSLTANESYTNNLSSYFNQTPGNGAAVPPVNVFGGASNSLTVGGGATYLVTEHLSVNGQATHYNQSYFGNTFSGTFLAANVNYGRQLLHMLTFSAGVVESSNGLGNNSLGFLGTANYFHRWFGWDTAGTFGYAQNVQSVLITETRSYYNYTANVHRRFTPRFQWTAAVNGNHSGFDTGHSGISSSLGFSTTLTVRYLAVNAQYLTASGYSVVTPTGIVPVPPLPGIIPANVINYDAKSYGGGLSWTPVRRLVLSGTYSRSLSDTLTGTTFSKNNTEIIYGQLQYHLRRISLLAGATRFTQGISATGVPPGTVTSYYGGISRWFDFF